MQLRILEQHSVDHQQCVWNMHATACFEQFQCIDVHFSFQTGESLVDGGHYATDDIESCVEELFEKWEELRVATDKKGVGLEQAISLVHFNRKVDGVQSLIRDRVAVACSQETGRDLEHCQVLMKKFDEFEKVEHMHAHMHVHTQTCTQSYNWI